MEIVAEVGLTVRDVILGLAALLKQEAAPGVVTLTLLAALVVCVLIFAWSTLKRRAAVRWLMKLVAESSNQATFGNAIASVDSRADTEASSVAQKSVVDAWREYRETFVPHEEGGASILRNSVRPSLFFNAEDLGFAPGFWRIMPGLFVTIGLFLTFLGLISALNSMDLGADKVQASLRDLLTIASAKFIMSLTGLFCSIVFTVVLRWGTANIDSAIHRLCGTIERRLSFISLEALAVEQLAAIREQREHFRMIGLELVAELGRPLREELPNAISSSIGAAVGPLLDKVGKIGTDGMGAMVNDLSARFSDDVGRALAHASEKLVQAGDRIAQMSERMDQSTGKVGPEIDAAVTRLAQAVDDLRGSMRATADTASSAFTRGAEHLLSVMNQTLEGIRDNTGEGARALSAAAAEMREAAEGFRTELDGAARTGAEAASAQMSAASAQAAGAIGSAGQGVLDAFGRSAAEISAMADQFASKAAEQLLAPLDRITERLGSMVSSLSDGASVMRRLSDGVQAGAEATELATGNLKGASQELVAAVTPIRGNSERIEAAIRQLSAATESIAATVSRSAQATAESAAATLKAAEQTLGGHARAIEASLAGVGAMVDRLKGQGDRLDEIDEKLGRAFEVYTERVATAVDGLFGHVGKMQDELAPALDTLRAIVEQAEQFAPESRRIKSRPSESLLRAGE
jgi:ABC-type transporter Mla subunit MlaD